MAVDSRTMMILFQQEIQGWEQAREIWTLRHRVQERLKSEQGMKNAEAELEKCEQALDELDKMFTEYQKSHPLVEEKGNAAPIPESN